ncbi:unnamed protein product [Clonostachys solani]|uniref:F-box domain-containing protein n=1 Tax=Clonostachys solani TaxID=160281 RepID=A0A9N9ZMP0_9HYPO|nr:unnamed protein product [Clonostachys solani]
MGSWECYCAICAVTMQDVQFRGLDPGLVRDLADVREAGGESGGEDEDEEEVVNEECYDPKVLDPRDTQWLSDCRIMGINPATEKVFISGPGAYVDYGQMDCEPGDDPEAEGIDGMEDMACYQGAFPFHWNCYLLLCRRLTGSDETSRINKDVLHSIMQSLEEDGEPVLGLDYARDLVDVDWCPGEQAWGSFAGQEFFVTSPWPVSELSSQLPNELSHSLRMSALDTSMSGKVKADPFSKLPQEVTEQILSHVSQSDLQSLLLASWVIHAGSHDNDGFWKRRIKKEMPWFCELDELLGKEESSSIESIKGLFLWASDATKPREGITGPLMAISNRRRV